MNRIWAARPAIAMRTPAPSMALPATSGPGYRNNSTPPRTRTGSAAPARVARGVRSKRRRPHARICDRRFQRFAQSQRLLCRSARRYRHDQAVPDHPSGGTIFAKEGKIQFGVLGPFNGEPASAGNGSMVALQLDDPAAVDGFHAKVLSLGGRCDGAPRAIAAASSTPLSMCATSMAASSAPDDDAVRRLTHDRRIADAAHRGQRRLAGGASLPIFILKCPGGVPAPAPYSFTDVPDADLA